MVKAVILAFDTDVKGREVASIEMEDGRVVIHTSYSGVRERLMEGITGRQGREFTMEDGEDFIRELPYAITGSVMRAKLV